MALTFYAKNKTLTLIPFPKSSGEKGLFSLFAFSCSLLFSSFICHSFFQQIFRSPTTCLRSSENRTVKKTPSLLPPQGHYCKGGITSKEVVMMLRNKRFINAPKGASYCFVKMELWGKGVVRRIK